MSANWKAPRSILCATDLTPSCDRSVDRAMQLAGFWQASLLVVHVVDDTRLPARDFAPLTREREIHLRREISSHPAAAAVEVDTFVALGRPAEKILGLCERMFIDFLIMGPGERTTLGERLLGSTVDQVLRQSLQPVLSVRNRTAGPYQAMAIATDFSPRSRAALDCALSLFPDAKATVVHAYDDTLSGPVPFDKVTGPLADQHRREMRAEVEQAMLKFIEPSLTVRPDLAGVVASGEPAAILKSRFEQSACDLVVVGTHGRTGLRRAVIGSIAERVIGTSPCDVLAVRQVE